MRLRLAAVGICGLLLAFGVRTGLGYQRSAPAPSSAPMSVPDYSSRQTNQPGQVPYDDPMTKEMEGKRARAVSSERQRILLKDADQMVQTAAELQARVTQDPQGAGRDDEAKRAESIEKLAKDLKERMKGSR